MLTYGSSRYVRDTHGLGDWLTDILGLTPGMKAYEDAKKAGVTVSDVIGPTPTTEGTKALEAAAEVERKVTGASIKTAEAIVKKRAEERARKGATEATKATLVAAAVVVGIAWLVLR
jgi:hypothetical protein